MGKSKIGIVGGGPAGLAAAIEAAGLGLSVDLFERNRVGDHIRCAEGFVDTMHQMGKPATGVRFKVDEALLQVEQEYQIRCRGVRIWMIDRTEWQRSLAEQARAAGARIHEHTRIDGQGFLDLQQDYDWVIDASGAPSLASLQHGFRDYYRKFSAYTAQYVMEGDFSRFGKRVKFVLFPNYEGYYWVFPKGRDTQGRSMANVGIGMFRERANNYGDSLWTALDRLNAREQIEGRVLRRHGGIVPIRLREQLEYGNVLLAGDAAGCASPLHGGGIDTSYSVGQLAARWIAVRSGNLSEKQFPQAMKNYSTVIRDFLRPKLRVEEKLCRLWSQMDSHALDTVASLATRDCRKMKIWNAMPLSGLLLCHSAAGYRLWAGLTRGRW